jgi:hypothetical protein
MADGLNPAQLENLNNAVETQGKSTVDATNAVGNKIDGLHQLQQQNDKQLLEAVNALPKAILDVYNLLTKVVTNLEDIDKVTKETKDSTDKAKAKAPAADKAGISTIQKENDVASKVPMQFAAPALMLNQTLKDLLGEKSSIFKEIQKITNGTTTKDKLDKKDNKKGGGGSVATELIGPGAGIASFGLLGATLGVIISSATLFAKTPFAPAFRSTIPAKRFINELKDIIKAEDNPFPTKAQMMKFTEFCAGVKLGTEALKSAARASASMVIVGPIALLGIKISERFINMSQDLIANTNKRRLDIKKFTDFCVNLKISFSSLFKAAILAFLLLFVVVPGIIGLKFSQIFINASIRLMQEIDIAAIPDIKNVKEFFLNLQEVFKALVITALLATAMLLLGVTSILGLGMSFLFLQAALKLIFISANLAKKELEKGGNIDVLETFITKLQIIFKSLVISMLFAVLAGLLALPATLALVGITLFFLGVTLIGLLAKTVLPFIKTFTSVSIELAITMLIFAIAFLIIIHIMTPGFFGKILLTLLGVTLVFAAAAGIGFLAGLALPFIITFAAASILLSLAFLFLFVGMFILSLISIDEKKIEKMRMIGEFFVVFSSFVKYFLIGAIAALFLALASVLLMVSLIVFTLALLVLNFSLGMLDVLIKEKPPEGAPGGFTAYGGLAMIALFFMMVGVLGPFALLAAIAAIPILIASLLLMVSFIALTVTFLCAAFLLGIFDIIGPDLPSIPGYISLMFLLMCVAGLAAIPFIILAVPLLLASILLMTILISLTIAFAFASILAGQKLEQDQIKKIGANTLTLFGIFGIMLFLNALKVIVFAAPVLAAAVMIMVITASLVAAYKSIQKLDELQGQVDPKPVINAVKELMQIIKDAGTYMKGMSKEAAEAFSITLGSIIGAIDSMVDIIIKLSYFETEEGHKLLEKAMKSLTMVINDFFLGENDETKGVINILGKLGGISSGKLRAAQALEPITEALDNITDVIIKLNGMTDISQGITRTREVMEFINEIIKLASAFTPEPKGIVGAVRGFFVGNTADSLEAGLEVMQKIPELLDAVSIINDSIANITGLNESSKNVLDMMDFVSKIIEFTGTFKKGGFFGGGSTEEEIATAKRAITALKPLIDELNLLNMKIISISGLTESTQKIRQLIPLVRDVTAMAINLSTDFPKMNKAEESARILVRASGELVALSNNIDKLQNLKTNLENNLVKPLLELDEPANRVTQVANAVTRLNSELTKLARENKDTLKTLSSLGNGGGILSFVSNTVGNLFGVGSSSQQSDPNSQLMAANIAKIQKSVQKLDDKFTKDETTWTSNPRQQGRKQ